MQLFFKTRQKARDFSTSRKANGMHTTVQDKGNVVHPMTGSKYAVTLNAQPK